MTLSPKGGCLVQKTCKLTFFSTVLSCSEKAFAWCRLRELLTSNEDKERGGGVVLEEGMDFSEGNSYMYLQ